MKNFRRHNSLIPFFKYLSKLMKVSWEMVVAENFFKACVRCFSPNDSPLKTMKNVFYFILFYFQALFIFEIFKFLYFFPFLSTLSRFKRKNGSGIIYDVINWLAYIYRCNFWNYSKTALHYIIKFGQMIYNE